MSSQRLENYKRRRCSSSSDTSNEETLDLLAELEKPVNRKFKARSNSFVMYNDSDFKEKFTFSKETILFISNLIGHKIQRYSKRNCPLSAEEQILLTVNFYVTGSFQSSIGDDGNVHKSTVSRIIRSVTEEISALKETFVNLPRNETEINRANEGFKKICSLPKVLGCVESTHVPIISPGGPSAELYRNKKGRNCFSIQLQIVCDSRSRITDAHARSCGSYSKNKTFEGSAIKNRLESLEFLGNYLIGSKDYTCCDYLLTPIFQAATIKEQKFNESHANALDVALKTVNLLKGRFLCLTYGLRTKIHTSFEIIEACVVLHNIALLRGDFYEAKADSEKREPAGLKGIRAVESDENKYEFRTNLIETLFD